MKRITCLSFTSYLKILIAASLFSFCFPSFISAQTHTIDSLQNVLKTEKEDTNKVNTLNKLSIKLWVTGNYDSSMTYAKKEKSLADKIGYKIGLADALTNIGIIYENQGNYQQALKHFNDALIIYQLVSFKQGIANSLSNIGTIYWYQADYSKALEYDSNSLVIYRKIGHKVGIANNLGNIGLIYYEQGKYPEALEYYYKALSTNMEIGDKYAIAGNLGNIGLAYHGQHNYTKALEYHFKALAINQETGNRNYASQNLGNISLAYCNMGNYSKALEYDNKALAINQELGDKDGMAGTMGNIGNIYEDLHNFSKALEFDFKSLNINREIGDKDGIAINLENIGNCYTRQANYTKANIYLDSSLNISKSIGDKDVIKNAYNMLSINDSARGNYKLALEDFKQYMVYHDSLINEANIKKTVQAEMNFDFQQKQIAEKAEQDKKDALTAAEGKRQKIIILLIAFIAITLALALYIIFNSLKNTRKEKLLVEKQKVLVELQALRAQMNPHFIFNAINSIKQFIFENDTESADRHLSRFASLIRKVLENSKQESIPLSEEIQMLTLYIELEMLRFANKFSYKIETDENIDTEKVLISPLIIQPYVENAIWHGLMHQEKHGELLIKFEIHKSSTRGEDIGGASGAGNMLKCIIDDNGIGRQRSAEIKRERNHKSMGLSITKERLEILNMINKTKMNLEFIDKTNENGSSEGTRVELFMPLILSN